MKNSVNHAEPSDQQLEDEFRRVLEKRLRRKILRKLIGFFIAFVIVGTMAVILAFPAYYLAAGPEGFTPQRKSILITFRTKGIAPGDVVVLSDEDQIRTACVVEVQDENVFLSENMETICISRDNILGKVLCYILPEIHGESNR